MIVDVLNGIVFLTFLVMVSVGAGATLARVVSYGRSHRPRLLTRDVQVIGGLALTVGMLFAVRVARAIGFDVSGLSTNVVWTLATAGPVLWAVSVYAYFELFVIEKAGDAPYLDREHPEANDNPEPRDGQWR